MKTSSFWLARIYFLFGLMVYLIGGKYMEFLSLPSHRDPILELIPVIDVGASIYILIFLYVVAFVFSIPLFNTRKEMELWLLMASTIVLRMAMCFIAGFGPPPGYFIPEKEVGAHLLLLKFHLLFRQDFFFSGHTAMPFLFFLFFENKTAKIIFLTGTIAMAVSVLLLHHHYVIDVIAAPVIVWAVYSFFKFMIFGNGRR